MTIRVAINGFGRIGRLIFRTISERSGIDIIAINDLAEPKIMAHLLKYDTVFGRFDGAINVKDNALIVNGKRTLVYSEKNPLLLPWKQLNIDFAIESTGLFTSKVECEKHIEAGAKYILLTAPSKDAVDATIVMGVNHEMLKPEHKV